MDIPDGYYDGIYYEQENLQCKTKESPFGFYISAFKFDSPILKKDAKEFLKGFTNHYLKQRKDGLLKLGVELIILEEPKETEHQGMPAYKMTFKMELTDKDGVKKYLKNDIKIIIAGEYLYILEFNYTHHSLTDSYRNAFFNTFKITDVEKIKNTQKIEQFKKIREEKRKSLK